MGLTEPTTRMYLNIGFGKIRKKCDPTDPKAVERSLESGEKVYAREYKDLSGVLENIAFKTHAEYGNSWLVYLNDGDDKFVLQIKENDRYGGDFLRRVPNLHKGLWYKFTPYDFTPEGTEKRKKGLSIRDKNDNHVESAYQVFTKDADGKTVVENINGFPNYEGKWGEDKDEQEIYFKRVTKFLRSRAQQYITEAAFGEIPAEQVFDVPKDDDLPF